MKNLIIEKSMRKFEESQNPSAQWEKSHSVASYLSVILKRNFLNPNYSRKRCSDKNFFVNYSLKTRAGNVQLSKVFVRILDFGLNSSAAHNGKREREREANQQPGKLASSSKINFSPALNIYFKRKNMNFICFL